MGLNVEGGYSLPMLYNYCPTVFFLDLGGLS